MGRRLGGRRFRNPSNGYEESVGPAWLVSLLWRLLFRIQRHLETCVSLSSAIFLYYWPRLADLPDFCSVNCGTEVPTWWVDTGEGRFCDHASKSTSLIPSSTISRYSVLGVGKAGRLGV